MSSLYPIIGLAGKQASGKTCASDFLAKTYNGASIALADPIKRFLFQLGASEEALWGSSELRNCPADLAINKWKLDAEALYLCKDLGLNNLSGYQLMTITEKLANSKIRDCLKVIGTDWGRNTFPDVWIRYGLKLANTLLATPYKYEPIHGLYAAIPSDYVIISDLRFKDEILAIKAIGGLVLKIKAKNDNKDQHVSETELDTVPDHWFNDTVFNNKDGVENFHKDLAWKMHKHFRDFRGI